MKNRTIVLFELNEVPFRIIDAYSKQHPRSSIARLLAGSQQYRSHSEDVGPLSPWQTWPSMHRGVPDEKHFISDFGQSLDEIDRAYPPVWRQLANAGIKVGMGGSLHSYPLPADLSNYAFYIPDIFAKGPECFPASLSAFQGLCLNMARDSARNASRKLPLGDAMRVLAQAPALGFTAKTAGKIASQLVGERRNPWKTNRRRTLQAVLAFDVFMKQLEATQPQFTTFFTNHVASSMHRYWAAAFPEDYEKPAYPPDWIATYGDEIYYAMGEADEMLAKVMAYVDRDPNRRLIVASSMGQQAIVAEPLEVQVYINNPGRFFERLGIQGADWEERPSMFAQYNFVVKESMIARLEAEIPKVHIDRFGLGFRRGENGFFSIDFGHANLPNCQVTYNGQSDSLESWGLFNLEITDKSGCSAYHIHEGSLMVYGGMKPSGERPQVSALDLCPAILKNFGVKVPDYMRRSEAFLSNA